MGYFQLSQAVGHPQLHYELVNHRRHPFGRCLIAHAPGVQTGSPRQHGLFVSRGRTVELHHVGLGYAGSIAVTHAVLDADDVTNGVAKAGPNTGRAHHRHPGAHQALQAGLGVAHFLAGLGQVLKQELRRFGRGGVGGRLAPVAVQALYAVVQSLDPAGQPQPVRGALGHVRIQHYQVGVKAGVSDPNLVPRLVVQDIAPAQVELSRRKGRRYRHLQGQLVRVNIGPEVAAPLVASFP